MALRLFLLCLAMSLAACSAASEPASTVAPTTTERPTPTSGPPPPPLGLTSPAFEEGQPIPQQFTCEGDDVNPQLDLVGLPPETITLAIIMDDPDAPIGVWDHWVEYDIEAAPGEFTIEEATASIGVEGLNSWNVGGYGGPCPPPGELHRYFFTIYVLNDRLDLPPGIDADGLRSAMDGKIVDEVVLIGTYRSTSG